MFGYEELYMPAYTSNLTHTDMNPQTPTLPVQSIEYIIAIIPFLADT